jgi:transposase-like protein
MTRRQLEERFQTEDQCMAFLVSKRWPQDVRCPRCNSEKVHKLGRPWKWQCKQCAKNGYRFSPLVGTIFENTNVPLRVWFRVIFEMCHAKKGVSALQIWRTMGGKNTDKKGAYRTAWYMCHRIRTAMQDPEFLKLTGQVEVDETYIGGKNRNRHKNKRTPGTGGSGKTAVIASIARKGKVVAQVIQSTDKATLESFVRQTVAPDVDLLATDDNYGYRDPLGEGFPHESVNPSGGEYVRRSVHTGSIDSFWALLKRGIIGTFHKVSTDYLPLYVNEFSFRFNNRKNPDIFDDVVALA